MSLSPQSDWSEREDLAKPACAYVVDEAAHLVLMGHKRAGRNARDRLKNVLLGIGERLQGERRPKTRVSFDLRFDVVVFESEHAATGMVDQDNLTCAKQSL